MVCNSVRTRSAWVPCSSRASPVIVPPAPQQFLSRFSSSAKCVSSCTKPRITVIMRPCLRFSTAILAVCFPGGVRTGPSGGHVHSDSGFSHRSQCGGRSNFVPARSPTVLLFMFRNHRPGMQFRVKQATATINSKQSICVKSRKRHSLVFRIRQSQLKLNWNVRHRTTLSGFLVLRSVSKGSGDFLGRKRQSFSLGNPPKKTPDPFFHRFLHER